MPCISYDYTLQSHCNKLRWNERKIHLFHFYSQAEGVPGVQVFRFESSLYYANVEHFRSRLYKLTGCNPRTLAIKRAKQIAKREKERKESKVSSNPIARLVELSSSPLNIWKKNTLIILKNVFVNKLPKYIHIHTYENAIVLFNPHKWYITKIS